ncbi:MAG TPA: DUF6391 domain-containing protein [Anaerolineales bacterium]|nr:DUF6391 domain-containing protein [Anaerolineales bacterium]HRF46125.1 DUF6391 domain-containing protein [Anaerolineales bacterium]
MFASLLRSPLIDRTRRNHGLEHATITVLGLTHRVSLAGRSTPNGFYIHGDVDAEAIARAAEEALRRLRAGERELAIHPHCGTNYVTAGVAAAGAVFVAFMGTRDSRERFDRLPVAASLATLALIAAQPLGLSLQRSITTSAEVRDMRLVSVRVLPGPLRTHFVETCD